MPEFSFHRHPVYDVGGLIIRKEQIMDFGRIILNIGFWIIFPVVFDMVSGAFFPDMSWEVQAYLLIFGLCVGTFLFNLGWYWFRLRR